MFFPLEPCLAMGLYRRNLLPDEGQWSFSNGVGYLRSRLLEYAFGRPFLIHPRRGFCSQAVIKNALQERIVPKAVFSRVVYCVSCLFLRTGCAVFRLPVLPHADSISPLLFLRRRSCLRRGQFVRVVPGLPQYRPRSIAETMTRQPGCKKTTRAQRLIPFYIDDAFPLNYTVK